MFKILKANKEGNKKGFTLIEVITVLFVISLGMIGVLSLIAQNIQSQSLNKNTLVAYQLAQEGVELIRQVRDTNWLKGEDWKKNLGTEVYYMDYLDITPHRARRREDGNLRQDSNGFYLNNPDPAPTASMFSRIIEIHHSSEQMQVISKVYWTDHGRSYVYSLEALLYDWK